MGKTRISSSTISDHQFSKKKNNWCPISAPRTYCASTRHGYATVGQSVKTFQTKPRRLPAKIMKDTMLPKGSFLH